jgi:hypothetical protein
MTIHEYLKKYGITLSSLGRIMGVKRPNLFAALHPRSENEAKKLRYLIYSRLLLLVDEMKWDLKNVEYEKKD